jgi:hypothetical protein
MSETVKRTFCCLGDTVTFATFLGFQHLVEVPLVCYALEFFKALRDDLFAFYLRHFQESAKSSAGREAEGVKVDAYRWRSYSSTYLPSRG